MRKKYLHDIIPALLKCPTLLFLRQSQRALDLACLIEIINEKVVLYLHSCREFGTKKPRCIANTIIQVWRALRPRLSRTKPLNCHMY